MKFPEKYIIRGEFILHSGQKSSAFYDVNAMLTDDLALDKILREIPSFPYLHHYVGIATGGAIIGRMLSWERKRKFSMIKDGKIKGERPKGDWLLIDDIVTTGKSLLEAITIVGSNPREIITLVDRRERNENPLVRSIFERVI